jgi:hypothetical protein
MPEWLYNDLVGFLVGGTSCGLLGYWLHAKIDERFTQRREQRNVLQSDIKALRDELLVFLGEPRSYFDWLESLSAQQAQGGLPSAAEKAEAIAVWVSKNAARYPKDRRGPMYLIVNVANQLARGDRHVLNSRSGPEDIVNAWGHLDSYAQELTGQLRGK